MKGAISTLALAVMVLAAGAAAGHAATPGEAMIEQQMTAADGLWMKGGAKQAQPIYEQLLKHLPAECEPFRPLLIMRLAYAQFSQGNKAGCLCTLGQMETLSYVPEHHALAAAELKAVIAGEVPPGRRRTDVPRLPRVTVTIHVSATAGEGGDGSKRHPVRTLSRAIDLVREGRSRGKTGEAEIVLEPGTYRQEPPVHLSAPDDGLVIRSRDPKRPALLSGGAVLLTWKKITDETTLKQLPESVRDRVLVCDLSLHGIPTMGELVLGGFSSARAGGSACRFRSFPVPELFYKGQPQVMARWPDDKLTRLPIRKPPADADPRYARWAKETDLWLYGYWGNDWADAYEKVAGIDASGKIALAPPTSRYGFSKSLGCAVNALCELDREGEWHLDTKRGLVHFLPPKDFDPEQCIVSSSGTIVSAENCQALQLRDLRIEYVRGDALVFRNCSNLLLANVGIRNCSGLGIQVDGGKRHLLHSCTIDSMGRGGIDLRAGDWQTLDPADSMIENCRISNLSRIDRTYTPALVLEGMGLRVRHNSFVNIPSSAIRVEACDALIELNYFRSCVYESGDQGAIDMWANPLYRGNIIRWNDFDRIINEKSGHWGAAAVRHDDFISGFMVFENVFRKGSDHGFGAVQFNQGTDNHVEGNLFIDWHACFSGGTTGGAEWKQRIESHENSKRVLEGTNWKSEAWGKKYPMVRDLFNGDDNHNYLADNVRLGSGSWGVVEGAVVLANREGSGDVHGESLSALKSVLAPWHPIPLDQIGPYASAPSRCWRGWR